MTEDFLPEDPLEDGATEEVAPSADERTDVERQRDEYLLLAQQTRADFENYKKRVARDVEDATARGGARVIQAVLPVLDALDLAVGHFGANASHEGQALLQARQLLLDTLAKEGLERLADGVAFDPTVHDAVAHVEGEGGEQRIDEVLRAGYRWKGVVLRPAMVRVKG